MKRLKNKIEKLNWKIYDISFGDNRVGWDICKYSPAGEDFIFTIEHNNSSKKAIAEIKKYAEEFDEDEHARLWANAENVGQPTTLRELIEDSEDIHKMLYELANAL